ncbi:SRPBCC domain-containing protein [Mesorhizobium sp. CAU 1741]|uniref:SRPBCC domain-containing protein n=1 Tax=Mesorhizobium sp. CAU 1741 TaxID=3140366 RepID=UPI00325BBD6C
MTDRTEGGVGTIVADATVRIERLLPGPAERIWDYLTDSEKRRKWLAAGPMEPRNGGAVEHLFRHAELSHEPTPDRYKAFENSPPLPGTVTQWDPPRTLAYSWPGDRGASEVTFELFPDGNDVLLVVTHRRLADSDTMVSVASGWDAHLGVLEDVLNGDQPRGFWSTHARMEAVYRERFALTTEAGVMPEHIITVERDFAASPAALYTAWTDAGILNRWFGRLVSDLRVGGRFRVETDGDDGETFVHSGKYLTLLPHHFIKFTFAIESDDPSPYADEFVALVFRDAAEGRSRLELHNGWNGPAPSDEDAELLRTGWSMWLDLLDELFEREPDLTRIS